MSFALEALILYALPVLAVVGAHMLLALIVYWDSKRSAPSLALTTDVLRKFQLTRSTERFRELPSMTLPFVAWCLGETGVQAVAAYRLSRRLLLARLRVPADMVRRIAILLTGIDISPFADIGPGFVIHHGNGIVIGKNTSAGRNLTLYHQVTTGSGRPRIGDDVVVWPGAKLIGDIRVGDGAQVGANAVVLKDVPSGATAVGVPARCVAAAEAAPQEVS